MKIFISRQIDNKYSFAYINDNDYFCHTIIVESSTIEIEDDSLFKIALLSNPYEAKDRVLTVIGVTISTESIGHFEKELKCKIICETKSSNKMESIKNEIASNNEPNSSNMVLCFSGGFDSLAALALLDKSVNTISIDFGAVFSREGLFFRGFDTNVLQWNLREKRLNLTKKFDESKNWQFMLVTSTIFKEENKPFYIVTGSIMESSSALLNPIDKPNMETYTGSVFGKDVHMLNIVGGITEYGTALIVKRSYKEDVVKRSLFSLADENSFKFFRKRCLLAIIDDNISEIVVPFKNKYKYGTGITDDIIVLYFIWKLGIDWVRTYYAIDVPDSAINFNMAFFEKINLNSMGHICGSLREEMILKLKSFGMTTYNSEDKEDLTLVYSYLMKDR